MIFHEVYGTYYAVLAEILTQAAEGSLSREQMERIIREKGFEESILTIPEKLARERWPLVTKAGTTPLRHRPTRPLTELEKRWMKSLLADPRIRLFDPPAAGLEDVMPLYPSGAIVYFDRYTDGDPYEDPAYIEHFRIILQALRERRWLRLEFVGHHGQPHSWRCIPQRLEYSGKDDKFRLITGNNRTALSVNLARITHCHLMEPAAPGQFHPRTAHRQTLVLELTDERNALERVMLHFSHLEKETEHLDGNHYRLTLHYETEDETELLIRVLSFGPALKVLSPEKFQRQLVDRLLKQQSLQRG